VLVSVPASPAAAEEVSVPPGDGHRIVIQGHGYGHGRGMSQWGAQGAARQGVGWQRIVEFYYPGTTWGSAGRRIKVRITADTTSDVVVAKTAGLRVRPLRGGNVLVLPDRATQRWRLLPSAGRTRVQFQRSGGRWRTWRAFDGPGEIWAPGATRLVTPSGTTAYRGRLRGVAGLTVNVLRLEAYLRGVVPKEVPALWGPDAVRAQSVAARTYAAFERRSRRGPWDVYDTTASQVYGGADAEHPASDAAIRATRRKVLLHDGKPAFTQFSASSGGWTAGGSQPYLVTKRDDWDDWDGNHHHDWRVRTRDGAIEAKFPAVGDLRSIAVDRGGRRYRRGGRAVTVTLRGTDGTVTVRGDDVRWKLGLKSTWFRFRVR
jgi:SpoIID/LytB domain protein